MKAHGVTPLLIYNIFDESAHTASIANEVITFSALAPTQELAELWILEDSIVVTDVPGTTTYVLDTDYSIERDDTTGLIEITRIATGAIGATGITHVDYDYATPGAVTTTNVNAGIDEIQNILTALGFANLPGWVTCPKYSQITVGTGATDPASIRANLKVNAQALNTVFTTRFVYDIDETDYDVTVAAGAPDISKISDDKDVTSEHG
ncbi:MAG: hypothetical protein GY869_22275, partial [Planctomycetes bacterium]|nr:hypothetical protein [Planctomycetota bacterium]